MNYLPKSGLNTQLPSLPSGPGLAIDYMRVRGPAQIRLQERFGREMTNLLAAPKDSTGTVVRIGMASNAGPRSRNEDSAVAVMFHVGGQATPMPLILAAVADGVSGDVDAGLASAIAIYELIDFVIGYFTANQPGSMRLNIPSVEDLLLKACSAGHNAIKAQTFGGSTTLTGALIINRAAYIAHVGDSRAYLLNTEWKDMELITHDHRRTREWQDFNIATNEHLKTHPDGHVLYRALGIGDECSIDMTRRNLVDGSRLLLCTNGLWESVRSAQLYSVVHLSNNPQDSCERLVSLALANGTHDDMTAVLVEMPD